MVRPITEADTGLRVVIEPTCAPGDTVDIVAVHGLGAHPRDTWTKKRIDSSGQETWISWLEERDMLPAWAPQARIMRYGYKSDWFGPDSIRQTARIVAGRLLLSLRRARKDCMDRPLLFIAHSYGGLVVMKLVCEAYNAQAKWPGIFNATKGIAFFGTPFRGADGMTQSEMLEAAYREYAPEDVQNAALSMLDPDNELLQDLVDRFMEVYLEHRMRIACFYELQASEIGAIVGQIRRKQFIVNERSGCLDLTENCRKFPLARTHFNMNKFSDPEEEDFLNVAEELEAMVSEALSVVHGHVVPAEEISEDVTSNSTSIERTAPIVHMEGMSEALVLFAHLNNHPGMYQIVLENFTQQFHVFDYEKALKLHSQRRFPDTGSWIMNQASYRTWMSSPQTSLLWLVGCPGIGKSMLATAVIDHFRQPSSTILARHSPLFYSLYHQQFNNTSVSMLCTLVHQILTLFPNLRQQAQLIGTSTRSEPQLWFLLRVLLEHGPSTHAIIVLDGVDFTDIPSYQAFFEGLTSLALGTKVWIGSRDPTRFQNAMHAVRRGDILAQNVLDLEKDCEMQLKRDFNLYLRFEINKKFSSDGLSFEQERAIFFHLGAMSTFLCGKLALNRLKQGWQRKALNVEVHHLPLELDAMYKFLVGEVEKRSPQYCRLILRYLLYGKDAFSVGEMKFACSLNDEELQKGSLTAFFDHIRDLYPLVIVSDTTGKIELTHHTVKEFLRQYLAQLRIEHPLHLGNTEAEQETAVDCLRRLELATKLQFPGNGESDAMRRKIHRLKPFLQEHLMLRYSLQYWYCHLQNAMETVTGASSIPDCLFWSVAFLTKIWADPKMRQLRCLMTLFGCVDHLDGRFESSRFVLLCALGLTAFVEDILNSRRQSRLVKYRMETALQLAIAGGHTALARMLISRGEITSLDGETFRGLLTTVITNRQHDMIPVLLKMRHISPKELHDAQSAIFGIGDEYALSILRQNSAFHGRPEWKATILHEEFSPARPQESREGTTAALARIKFLVEGEGIDVNARESKMGNTALHLACHYRYRADIVRALLEVGADVRQTNVYGWTPLHLASLYAREAKTIEFLLYAGGEASVSALTKCGNSPLHWSVMNSVGWSATDLEYDKQVSIITLLLQAGADPKLANRLGETPLSIASWTSEGRALLQGTYTALDGVHTLLLGELAGVRRIEDGDDFDVEFSRRMLTHDHRVRSFNSDDDGDDGDDDDTTMNDAGITGASEDG